MGVFMCLGVFMYLGVFICLGVYMMLVVDVRLKNIVFLSFPFSVSISIKYCMYAYNTKIPTIPTMYTY